jgi:hypothetical protein
MRPRPNATREQMARITAAIAAADADAIRTYLTSMKSP